MRIVLVEDSRDLLESLREYLLVDGYEVDGYTTTARLKATPGLEKIKVIAVTANVMKGDREKTLAAGCDGYIQKPIDVDQLPRQIARFLGRA